MDAVKRLHSHHPAVHDTGPDGEPNEAPMSNGVTRGEHKEDPECCIKREDHLKVVRTTLSMPRPAGRPDDGERPYAESEDHPYNHENDAKIFDAISFGHCLLLRIIRSRTSGTFSRVRRRTRVLEVQGEQKESGRYFITDRG